MTCNLTLLRLIGRKLDQPLPLDGKDAWSTIVRGEPSPHAEILINASPMSGAIRMGDWKLVVNGQRLDSDARQGRRSRQRNADDAVQIEPLISRMIRARRTI